MSIYGSFGEVLIPDDDHIRFLQPVEKARKNNAIKKQF